MFAQVKIKLWLLLFKDLRLRLLDLNGHWLNWKNRGRNFKDRSAAHQDWNVVAVRSQNVLRHLVGILLLLSWLFNFEFRSLILRNLVVLLLKHSVLSDKSLNKSLLLVVVV